MGFISDFVTRMAMGSDSQRHQRRKIAQAVAVFLFVAPIILLITLSQGNPIARIIGPVVLAPFWIAGGFMWNLARRLKATPISRVELESIDRPVLFLRSFTSDRSLAPAARTISVADTDEQSLARLFANPARFVAIGRPGEPLPTLGAQRVYVPDDEWQQVVSSVIARSGLIFLQAGRTAGLHWELREIRRQGALERTILFLPPVSKKDDTNTTFIRSVREELGLNIPDQAARSTFVALHQGGATFTDRYRVFYGIGSQVGTSVASFTAIFRPRPGFGAVDYLRTVIQMHPTVLFRAELAAILPSGGEQPDKLPRGIADYIIIGFGAIFVTSVLTIVFMLLKTGLERSGLI